MKLTNRQIGVLAQTVLEKLKKTQKIAVKDDKHKEIAKKFIENYKENARQIRELQIKQTQLSNDLNKDLGWNVSHFYSTPSLEHILKGKPSQLPSINDIEDKIVMESILDSGNDIEGFINKLVKKLSK